MSETSSSTSPLLPPRDSQATTTLATLLSRATSRRGASFIVRQTAARQLEERRADWGYSKPVVALDIVWNLAFIAASAAMLIYTANEKPNEPIRVWIGVYAAQCALHVLLVWLEYRRRNLRGVEDTEAANRRRYSNDSDSYSSSDDDDSEYDENRVRVLGISNASRFTKKCESGNTMLSFLWWLVGFYWVVSGGETLLQRAPHLYWLTVVFLAFDVFFAIFCVVLAGLIGIALCCCLPCIIAILYAVAGQEGASEADISILPKYKFQIVNDIEKSTVGGGRMVPIATNGGSLASERIVLSEDAECCICLSQYEDGADLHSLPCNHHFHSTCVVKWLKMNATCPLCKYNILKGNEQV